MPLIGLCSLCNALVKTVHIPGKPNKSERKFCPQPPAKGLLSQIIFSCNFVSRSVITRLCREIHHSLINYHCGSLSVGIKTGNLKTVAICSSNPDRKSTRRVGKEDSARGYARMRESGSTM